LKVKAYAMGVLNINQESTPISEKAVSMVEEISKISLKGKFSKYRA